MWTLCGACQKGKGGRDPWKVVIQDARTLAGRFGCSQPSTGVKFASTGVKFASSIANQWFVRAGLWLGLLVWVIVLCMPLYPKPVDSA